MRPWRCLLLPMVMLGCACGPLGPDERDDIGVVQQAAGPCVDLGQLTGMYLLAYTPIDGAPARVAEYVTLKQGLRQDISACAVTQVPGICAVSSWTCTYPVWIFTVHGEAPPAGFSSVRSVFGTLTIGTDNWTFTGFLITS